MLREVGAEAGGVTTVWAAGFCKKNSCGVFGVAGVPEPTAPGCVAAGCSGAAGFVGALAPGVLAAEGCASALCGSRGATSPGTALVGATDNFA